MTNLATTSVEPGTSPESLMQHTDAVQLSMLSSVLNGLEGGASLMRQHAQEALHAVRSGTYTVDSVQLSRLIVREALGGQ